MPQKALHEANIYFYFRGQINAGRKTVHISGDFFDVKARIESILSLSAHADYSEIIKYLSCQDKKVLKKIFLVHGEEDAKAALKDKLIAEGYKEVIIPGKEERFELT